MSDKTRINLGAGEAEIDGYDNSFDKKHGKDAHPLDLPDDSVDELRASHLFEHFGHHYAQQVLLDWKRVVKPGGLIKIAVPDFEKIAQMYLDGEPGPYQGWICGGQVDQYDVHLAQYSWNTLRELMQSCGLVGIHKWEGEGDCSTLPISLNMAAYKQPDSWPHVACAMSRPRLGFQDQFGAAMEALLPLGIATYHRSGAYYGQCMTAAIENCIEVGAEWILTLDYDTLFTIHDVQDLLAFATHNDEVDALVPVQMHRMDERILMIPKTDQTGQIEIPISDFDATYYPLRSGHFGCTLIRASALQKMKKPWFYPTPDSKGEWGPGHIDDDVNFWLEFGKAKNKIFLAPRVVVGHLEQVALWPDKSLKRIYQQPSDWWVERRPRGCWQ